MFALNSPDTLGEFHIQRTSVASFSYNSKNVPSELEVRATTSGGAFLVRVARDLMVDVRDPYLRTVASNGDEIGCMDITFVCRFIVYLVS